MRKTSCFFFVVVIVVEVVFLCWFWWLNVVVIPVFDLVIVVARTEFMKRIAVGMDDVNETGIRRFQSAK